MKAEHDELVSIDGVGFRVGPVKLLVIQMEALERNEASDWVAEGSQLWFESGVQAVRVT
jgi:hypothetical protein